MADPFLLIALGIYVAAYVYARGVRRKAHEALDSDDARRLTESPNPTSPSLTFGIFVVAILGYVLARRTWPESPFPGLVFATGLLSLYVGYTALQTRHLRSLRMPGFFLRAVLLGGLAQGAAVLTLIVVLASRAS